MARVGNVCVDRVKNIFGRKSSVDGVDRLFSHDDARTMFGNFWRYPIKLGDADILLSLISLEPIVTGPCL